MATTAQDFYRRAPGGLTFRRRGIDTFERLIESVRRYRRYRLDRACFLHLRDLEDWALEDMGYTREDVERAARLPLRVNAAKALDARVRAGRTDRAA